MKINKILASILALAMILSTMGTVAFADETNPNPYVHGRYLAKYGDTPYLCVEVYDFVMNNSFKVDLYSGETKIATASLATDKVDAFKKYNESLGCCFGIGKDFDDYWDCEWYVVPSAYYVPDSVKVYIDDVLVDRYSHAHPNDKIDNIQDPGFGNTLIPMINNGNAYDTLRADYWAKVDGVYDNRIDSFGLSPEGDITESYLRTDMFEIYAKESLEIQLWSEDTQLSSTVWAQSYPVDKGIGGYLSCPTMIEGISGYWDTTWLVEPSSGLVPTKSVLVVDGIVTDEMVYSEVKALKDVVNIESWFALEGVAGVAKIDEVEYASLQKAIEAAKNDDTITLINDIKQKDGVKITDKNITIDLAGHSFTVTEGSSSGSRNILIKGSSNVTIKNGTIVASGDYSSGTYGTVRAEDTSNVVLDGLKLYNYRGNGLNIKMLSGTTTKITNTEIYSEYGGGIEAAGGNIELDNVEIYQKGMYTAPYNSMAISVNGGGTVTVNSGYYETIPLKAEDAYNQGSSHGSWAAGVLNSGGTLIINGGTFVNGNFGDDGLATAARGLILADTGANIQINDGTFDALKGIIDIQNNLGDVAKNPTGVITGGIFSADPTNNYVKIAEGYSVEASGSGGYGVIKGTEGKASEITVKFKESVEGAPELSERERYIVLDAGQDSTINDFESAHFTFVNGNKENIDYTITPNADLDITAVDDITNPDRISFYRNADEENTNEISSNVIILGTVKFEGYGTVDFSIDKADAKVNATTLIDNIVDTFIPVEEGSTYPNKLIVDNDSLGDIIYTEQARKLNVVINFNNDITSKSADYTDMKVEVTGQNGEKHLGLVGNEPSVKYDAEMVCATVETDGKTVTLPFTVTAGYRYTVKVSGAGYRTAEYTFVMDSGTDAAAELTFWNNVKDEFNKTEIESGSDRWYTKNFLAGEIVQDNKINKYDLAAVVSYFGEDNLVENRPEYNKYDLNRDGVIDSEDIAYVLVSFGE